MIDDFEARLKDAFPDSQVTLGAKGRFWVALNREQLIPAVGILRDRFSIIQLAVIVGEDLRDAFQCNYVFTGPHVVILQVRIDREKPTVPSLSQIVPGAMVYERELKDLFGIMPVGHPDLRRQAVPEDWPEGVYPLRKDAKFSRDGELLGKEAE
ncbi:MAG: NADH-quinone oxidoreductase subunit C [Acidobacteriota bacterium]|jgi:Ni,Fe-hydrogenase III component G|nr:NADH-quinone oxidoreductase subunit C [Acidobacteriota bacterium]